MSIHAAILFSPSTSLKLNEAIKVVTPFLLFYILIFCFTYNTTYNKLSN